MIAILVFMPIRVSKDFFPPHACHYLLSLDDKHSEWVYFKAVFNFITMMTGDVECLKNYLLASCFLFISSVSLLLRGLAYMIFNFWQLLIMGFTPISDNIW